MKIYLVCDTSGSMSDAGKAFIMRTLSLNIAQWIRLAGMDVDLKLYSWAESMEGFPTWSFTDEFPREMLSCKGKLAVESLIEILGSAPDGKVLILTDGYWNRERERQFKRWKDGLTPSSVNFIKIGADANPQFRGDNVFLADEWLAALEIVVGGSNR